jgi:hypothetical protein
LKLKSETLNPGIVYKASKRFFRAVVRPSSNLIHYLFSDPRRFDFFFLINQ